MSNGQWEIDRKKVYGARTSDTYMPISFRLIANIKNKNYTFDIFDLKDKRKVIKYNNIELFDGSEVLYIDEPVVLLDYVPSYSHFIVDILGKFLYINKYFSDVKPFFIISDYDKNNELHNKQTHTFEDIINIFNKNNKILNILNLKDNKKRIIFKEVYSIYPEHELDYQRFKDVDSIYPIIRNMFIPKRESKNNRKVFISREDVFEKRGGNTKILEEKLKNDGYEIVLFENLSLNDQIEVFYDSNSIIAINGTSLVNLLFSNLKLNVLSYNCIPGFDAPEWSYISKKFNINYTNIYIQKNKVNEILNIFNILKDKNE